MNRSRRNLLIGGALAVLVGVAVVLSIVLGDDEDATPSSPGSADASAVTAAEIDVPPKTIGVFCPQCQVEVLKRVADATVESVELVGWEPKFVDSDGDPAKMQQQLAALVNSRVDAIIGVIIAPGPVAAALEQARRAQIPVVNVGFPDEAHPAIVGNFVADEAAVTDLLVERMGQDLSEGASVATIELPAYSGVRERVDTFVASAESRDFDVVARHGLSDLTRLFEGTTQAGADLIRANPDLDAFYSGVDFGGQALAPAIAQSGKEIPVYSYYAIPSVLELVADGKVVVVEEDHVKTAFQAVDQLLRYFTDGTPIDDAEARDEDPVEFKIVDDSNVPAPGSEVYPTAELLAPYATKWAELYPAGS